MHREAVATLAQLRTRFETGECPFVVNGVIGIASAAKALGMPVAIAFTVETDGRLPCGQHLSEAIQEVDAATDGYPAYYMINCVHSDHLAHVLQGDWTQRITGLRANASRMSHAELDAGTSRARRDWGGFSHKNARVAARGGDVIGMALSYPIDVSRGTDT